MIATSGNISSDLSTTFDVTPDKAVSLAFNTQPDVAVLDYGFLSQPTVAIKDKFGNTVEKTTAEINISITLDTGTKGAVLSGTTKVAADLGEAYFEDLLINLTGTGYKLTASSEGLSSVTSNPFDVVPMPTAIPSPT